MRARAKGEERRAGAVGKTVHKRDREKNVTTTVSRRVIEQSCTALHT